MTTENPKATSTPGGEAGAANAAVAALLRSGGGHPFGPLFFLTQLAAFVRERCPEAGDRLPRVDLWVAGGEPIRVCHVIAIGPRWVAVAARDRDARDDAMVMRTELIPYELIGRVTIAGDVARGRGMGFDQARRPAIVGDDRRTPEEMLHAAAGHAPAT